MKILSISGDKNALQPGTDAHARQEAMRRSVDALDVFVWPQMHSVRDIVKAVRGKTYDVITAQDPFWRGALAGLIARTRGLRFNVQLHADLQAQSWFKRLLGAGVLRRAHSVRAVSEQVAVQVRGTGTKAKVHVLPIYVDIERFTHVARIPHDREIVLWVGRFEKEKDPLAAVAVLKQLRKDGHDVALIMLGAGRLEKELHAAAQGLPIEFPGWKEPEDYLALADVVLCTSRAESWGASIIEALAAGVPVVSPDVGIAREAGAIIADRAHLAEAVGRVLRERPQGDLKIAFLGRDAWVQRWKEALV